MSDYAYQRGPRTPAKIAERAENMLLRRWAACWIDLLVVGAVTIGLFGVAGAMQNGDAPLKGAALLAFALPLLALPLLYYGVCESLWGQTLGKAILGIVVVDGRGRRPNAWRSAARTLFRLVEINPFLFGGLPAGLVALLNPRRQRLGDLVAGTYVIPKKALGSLAPSEDQSLVFE